MDINGLLGRDDVVLAVSGALDGDQNIPLIIRGDRGIGKTACLGAARDMAETRGMVVVETTGSLGEAHLPFAGLHRLLRNLLPATKSLPVVQRQALLAALGLHDPQGKDSLVVRIATLNLLCEAARSGGLFVCVDDAHRLDEETRQTLAFVARRLDHHRIVMVGASSAPQETVFGDRAHEIALHELSASDAHRVVTEVAQHLGPAHRRWVVEQAAGNPLALREIAKIADSVDVSHVRPDDALPPLPEALQRIFAGRVHELPDAGRDVVLVAALAADPVLQVVLGATERLRGAAVGADVVELAQELGLFELDDRRIHFAHSLVRVAILQQESMSRRQAAHRALGEVVQSSHRRAWHRALGASAHDDDVAAELEATGLESARRGDTASALRALERAAQLTTASVDRGRRLLSAAFHAARLGEAGKVLQLLDAAEGTDLGFLDHIRAELMREEFGVVVIADSERMIHLCELADRAVAAGRATLHVDLIEAAARRRCVAEVSDAALDRLAAHVPGLAAAADDARTIAVVALADPVGHGRSVLSRLAVVDDAVVTDADEMSRYGVAARAVGDYARASQFFERAEVTLRAHGLVGTLAQNLCVTGDLRIELGEWERAAADLSEFATLSTAAMSISHRASVMASRAKLAALRGDADTALDLVGDAERSPTARRGNRFLARAQVARGIAGLSSDKHAEAYAALRCVFEPTDARHHFREQLDAVAYFAEAAAHAGQHLDAHQILRRLRQEAEASGSPLLSAQLGYAEAVLATDDHAERLFLTALASDTAGSSWHRARTQLAFGRWLRRRHRVVESRNWLQTALAVLQKLGAEKWASEALSELTAAGMPGIESAEMSIGTSLSAQELKIARYAAIGLTNKEIGDRLYLSPRTVGSHLYRLFPKLGITARAQLAARLEEGPAQPAR